MVAPLELWPFVAGLLILVLGLIAVRKDLAAAPPFGKIIVLGTVFFAAPLACFGAEHLVLGAAMGGGVPTWMPLHTFWIYFVGTGLEAAAISLALRIYLRWSAPLVALMFLVFVATIHAPNVAANPHDRFRWAVVLRDLSFGAGAMALSGVAMQSAAGATQQIIGNAPLEVVIIPPQEKSIHIAKFLIGIARIILAVTLLYFGVENFLHPECAPGVPLAKLMPAWVPIHVFWADLAGAIFLISGAALLINTRTRLVATLAGITFTLLTLGIYVPILATDRGVAQVVEGINYVYDTLLFAGALLLVAAAMPERSRTR